ncbi:MAG: hypothetical protein E6G60_15065, partial [Actinobacteria bacterium]
MRALRRPWLAYLVLGLAAVGVYFLVPWDTIGQAVLYDAIGASSAVAVVVGVRLNRPAQRLPWLMFAGGLLAFSVGDSIFNLYGYVWNRTPPIPSAADVFYLAGYPAIAAGLALLIFRFGAVERRAGLIDAALFTVAFALAQWVFLMKDLVHAEGSVASKAVAAAYPGMDVVLLSGLAVFWLCPAWRSIACVRGLRDVARHVRERWVAGHRLAPFLRPLGSGGAAPVDDGALARHAVDASAADVVAARAARSGVADGAGGPADPAPDRGRRRVGRDRGLRVGAVAPRALPHRRP